jgi:uncharacterized Fe-S cluster protein YjdI
MTKRLQIYETDAITVTFDPNVCIHSAVCLRGLPGVFDVRRRKWIDLDRGTAQAVAEVIRRCPSGALQYQMPGEHPMSHRTDTAPTTDVRIEVIKDGPVKVTGGITLVAEDGTTERQERVFLCRCGGSARKPLCDGTHKRNGFTSSG